MMRIRVTLGEVSLYVLNHHDGVVHDQAGRECDSEQG